MEQPPTDNTHEIARNSNRMLEAAFAEYLHLLNYPDSDLSKEEAQAVAGGYLAQHIDGKYTESQMVRAFFLFDMPE